MTVAIVGQGYVGLSLAVAAARSGVRVFGVDTSSERVEQINSGSSPIDDISDQALSDVLALGYSATADPAEIANCDTVVLCVPTPYHNDRPDLSYVEAAAFAVAPHLKPDTLVILESTTFPGTTDDVLVPILESGSGLTVGTDLHVVFSPERIDPGNPTYGLHNTPKIVGGTTPEATERAAAFYGEFVETVIRVDQPRTAEMAKLLENTFRHINIALVNELAIICRDLDVDVWQVIDAAASKPFGFMAFYPGPGVGGHCIPVDPMYLSWRVRQFGGSAKFIELARDVNDAMPEYCVSRVQDLLNDRERALKGSRILVLGVAYKPNIADLRESPAEPLIRRLKAKGADVSYHDPHAPRYAVSEVGELSSVELTAEVVAKSDCVVVVTPHAGIDLDLIAEHASLVFDTRNALPRDLPNVERL